MPKMMYNGTEYVGSIENNIGILYYSNLEPENLSKGMTWIGNDEEVEDNVLLDS